MQITSCAKNIRLRDQIQIIFSVKNTCGTAQQTVFPAKKARQIKKQIGEGYVFFCNSACL